MNKTIPITLAKQLFYIEEDAYELLSSYLDRVKMQFSGYPDSSEIQADIESRIAEHFLEDKKSGSDSIVSKEDVEKLMASMGQPESFDESHEGQDNASQQPAKKRKLFRNSEDMVVAGVASGIGAYFNVDPVIVRVLFVLSLLLGGGGILAYIILWLVMPLAESPTEKLQMRGEKVTLDSINSSLKEKVEEVKKNKNGWKKLISFPFVVLGTVFRFLATKIVPLLVKIFGVVVSLSAVVFMFLLTFALTSTLFNVDSPYMDFPLAKAVTGGRLTALVLAGFVAAVIPAILALFAGLSLSGKKNMFRPLPGFTLLGVWFASIITLGALAPQAAADYKTYMDSSPEYRIVTKSFDLNGFTAVSAANASRVSIQQGSSFAVTATGRARDFETLEVRVNNGTLETGRYHKFRICIFCLSKGMEVAVTMPSVEKITAMNASVVTAQNINSPNVKIVGLNASRLTVGLTASSTDIELSNASQATLTGAAASASISTANASRLDAQNFAVANAKVRAVNSSRVTVFASNTLTGQASNSSRIRYFGNPTLDIREENSSKVQRQEDNREFEGFYFDPLSPLAPTQPSSSTNPILQ